MSVLTKVFVVLLVVVSLLTSAGLIVFVNQTENFKVSLLAAENSSKISAAQVQAYRDAAAASAADAVNARKDRDDQAAKIPELTSKYEGKIADLNTTIAGLNSNVSVATVGTVNATSALTASEAQRIAQATQLTAALKDNDTLNKKFSDQSLAISDLTNRLEVAMVKTKEFSEADAQDRQAVVRLEALVKGYAGDKALASSDANDASHSYAPHINAIVDSTSTPGGIAHATISVGTDDDVKVGMTFYLVDMTKAGDAAFLGLMTIDSVDARSASGRLVGPNVAGVHHGVEAKTHLN